MPSIENTADPLPRRLAATVDEDIFKEPVNVLISVPVLPIFTPFCNTWNSIKLPVITVNEPVIVVLPFKVRLPLILRDPVN